jgi:hypothetical protein
MIPPQDCCNPRADPVVLKEGPSTAWVDGNNGLGVVVGTFRFGIAAKSFFFEVLKRGDGVTLSRCRLSQHAARHQESQRGRGGMGGR